MNGPGILLGIALLLAVLALFANVMALVSMH